MITGQVQPPGGGIDPSAAITVASITVTGLTANRLVQTDGAKTLASVANLALWIDGTSNQVTVTNDGDGTVTLSLPQDIHTAATPTFASLILRFNGSNATTLSTNSSGQFTVSSTADAAAFGGTFANVNKGISISHSSVGGSVGLAIVNTDNTNASSAANLFMQVGGTSAGDSYVLASVLSGASWSYGIDNSDSDKFKISNATSLGTNDYFTVTTAGFVGIGTTAPLRNLEVRDAVNPAFRVSYDASNYTDFQVDSSGNLNAAPSSSSMTIGGATPFGVNKGLTITYSSVGGAVGVSLRNTDNTNGGSSANVFVQVGGTSGGDPYTLYGISGGTSWSEGLDNSDSDSFKISNATTLGTSDYFTITTSGTVNIPIFLSVSSTTVAAGGHIAQFRKDQAGDTFIRIDNASSNAAATAGFDVTTGASLDIQGAFTAYVTGAKIVLGTSTAASGGLYLQTGTTAPIIFAPNALTTTGGAFTSTGQLVVGALTVTSTERFSVQKDQNDLTYAAISNTTSGTLGQAALTCRVASGRNMQMGRTSALFTTINGIAADEGYLTSDFGNLVISSSSSTGNIRILTNSIQVETIAARGWWTFTTPATSANTSATEINNFLMDFSAILTIATGAITNMRATMIKAPTYAFAGASTITNAATWYVDGAPIAGTNATINNPYAIWVDAGVSRFDGAVGIGVTSPSGQLHVSGVTLPIVNIQSTSTGGGAAVRLLQASTTTKFNWQIAGQLNSDNSFEITPSTAADGTTFTTPVFIVNRTGATTIPFWQNTGTATDATTIGDFAAGLTGANRVFYDQSVGKMFMYSGSTLILTFDPTGTDYLASPVFLMSVGASQTGMQAIGSNYPTHSAIGTGTSGGQFVWGSNSSTTLRQFSIYVEDQTWVFWNATFGDMAFWYRTTGNFSINQNVDNTVKLNVFDGTNPQLRLSNSASVYCTFRVATTTGQVTFTQAGGTVHGLVFGGNYRFAHGTSALATGATEGFLHLQSCAGTPTGTPASIPTGQVPLVIDSTNLKFFAYLGGAWKKLQVTAVDAIFG